MPVFRFDFELHVSQEAIIKRGEAMATVAEVQERIGYAAAVDVYEHVVMGQDGLLTVPALLSHVDATEPRTLLAGTIAVCETETDIDPVRFAGVWTMNDNEFTQQIAEILLSEHPHRPESGYALDLDRSSPVLGKAIAENSFLIQTAMLGLPDGADTANSLDSFLLPFAQNYQIGRPYTVAQLEEYFASPLPDFSADYPTAPRV